MEVSNEYTSCNEYFRESVLGLDPRRIQNLKDCRSQVNRTILDFFSGIKEPFILLDYQYLQYLLSPGLAHHETSEVIPVSFSAVNQLLKKNTSEVLLSRCIGLLNLRSITPPCFLPKSYQHTVIDNIDDYRSFDLPEDLNMDDFDKWMEQTYVRLEWETL